MRSSIHLTGTPGDDRGDDRTDIARIDADLVAEAAADVGRDDADIVLRDVGDQRGHRAHRVRRLEGAPDGELAVDLVHARRRSRRSRSGRDARADRRSAPRRPLRRWPSAVSVPSLSPISQEKMWLWCLRGPCAPTILSLMSSRSTGASASIALNGSTSAGKLLVVHLDEFDRVGGDVAVLGDDEGHFLALEQHLLIGEHGLHVAGQRRHVVQVERLEVGGGQYRVDARQLERRFLVDRS